MSTDSNGSRLSKIMSYRELLEQLASEPQTANLSSDSFRTVHENDTSRTTRNDEQDPSLLDDLRTRSFGFVPLSSQKGETSRETVGGGTDTRESNILTFDKNASPAAESDENHSWSHDTEICSPFMVECLSYDEKIAAIERDESIQQPTLQAQTSQKMNLHTQEEVEAHTAKTFFTTPLITIVEAQEKCRRAIEREEAHNHEYITKKAYEWFFHSHAVRQFAHNFLLKKVENVEAWIGLDSYSLHPQGIRVARYTPVRSSEEKNTCDVLQPYDIIAAVDMVKFIDAEKEYRSSFMTSTTARVICSIGDLRATIRSACEYASVNGAESIMRNNGVQTKDPSNRRMIQVPAIFCMVLRPQATTSDVYTTHKVMAPIAIPNQAEKISVDRALLYLLNDVILFKVVVSYVYHTVPRCLPDSVQHSNAAQLFTQQRLKLFLWKVFDIMNVDETLDDHANSPTPPRPRQIGSRIPDGDECKCPWDVFMRIHNTTDSPGTFRGLFWILAGRMLKRTTLRKKAAVRPFLEECYWSAIVGMGRPGNATIRQYGYNLMLSIGMIHHPAYRGENAVAAGLRPSSPRCVGLESGKESEERDATKKSTSQSSTSSVIFQSVASQNVSDDANNVVNRNEKQIIAVEGDKNSLHSKEPRKTDSHHDRFRYYYFIIMIHTARALSIPAPNEEEWLLFFPQYVQRARLHEEHISAGDFAEMFCDFYESVVPVDPQADSQRRTPTTSPRQARYGYLRPKKVQRKLRPSPVCLYTTLSQRRASEIPVSPSPHGSILGSIGESSPSGRKRTSSLHPLKESEKDSERGSLMAESFFSPEIVRIVGIGEE